MPPTSLSPHNHGPLCYMDQHGLLLGIPYPCTHIYLFLLYCTHPYVPPPASTRLMLIRPIHPYYPTSLILHRYVRANEIFLWPRLACAITVISDSSLDPCSLCTQELRGCDFDEHIVWPRVPRDKRWHSLLVEFRDLKHSCSNSAPPAGR